MFALLLFALFIFPVIYLYGQAAVHLLKVLFHLDPIESPNPILVSLVGLAALSGLATLMSLFIPLSASAVGIVLAGAVLILMWQLRSGRLKMHVSRMRFHASLLALLLVALVVVSIMEQATHTPSNPDSGIYHAQTIRWAETYPAVPGLGNLHGRLAFNSSWLVVQALFSFAFLGLQSFHLLPALLSLLVLFDCIGGLIKWLDGKINPANILKTFLIPVFFTVLPSEISSPGTDLPVVLLVWFIAAAWLERPRREFQGAGIHDLSLFILILFTITIKLSAAPLLILAALVAISALHRPVQIGKLAIVAAVFLAPWFARSVIQSGYLVYPIIALDIFQVDWKVPSIEAKDEKDAIVAYARLPRLERSEVLAMPTNTWLRQWFANLTLNRKLVLGLAVLSPFLLTGILTVETLWRERFRIWNIYLLQVYLTAFIGGIYWLFIAPDFRFGYGFLLLLILIPLLLPVTWISRELNSRTRLLPIAVATGFILFQVVFLARSFEPETFLQRILLPLNYPVFPSEPCALKDRNVLCASAISYNECWYDPFPCIPFPRPAVEFRGKTLQEGFMVRE
jgi:hypothetical protein